MRYSRAGTKATPAAQTLFSPEEHNTLWLQFLPDAEILCGLALLASPRLSLPLRWGLCCCPFVFNGTLVRQGPVSGLPGN